MVNYYIGRNKKTEIVEKSSSGGIMTAIAEWIIRNNGVVCGAAYSDDYKSVEHIIVSKVEELDKIRKSKYVWSDYSSCISEIEKCLSKNSMVLFVGTPCQCFAIGKRFKNYKSLYTLDFFCHGTLEEKYYKDYINQFKTRISKVDFRGESIDKTHNFVFTVEGENGEKLVNDLYGDNALTNLFVSSAGLKKGCFNCKLCEKSHFANITMGDVEFEEMAKNHGFEKKHLSIIAINDIRGHELFNKMCYLIDYDVLDERDNISFYYRRHRESSNPWDYDSELRDWFEKLYMEYGFKEAAFRCLYKKELSILYEYEEFISKKKIYLYGAGKIGRIIKELIEKYYPSCNLQGFIVSEPQESFYVGLPVYKFSDYTFKQNESFIFVSVENKNDIYVTLENNGLKKGINYV